MLSIFAALKVYGWRVTLKESRTTSSLHREQTEEMKGWMRFVFIVSLFQRGNVQPDSVFIAVRVDD